jgi:hypothetical protein
VTLFAIFREVWRDIVTGTARFSVLTITLAALSTVLVLADVMAVAEDLRDGERYRSSGASILTVVAPGKISGPMCESYAAVAGVQAAGAMRQSPHKLRFTVIAGAPVPTFEVSDRFAEMLTGGAEVTRGVAMSSELARTLGARVGDTAATSDGAVTIGSTFEYPSDGRRPGFGYAVFTAAAEGTTFDECWIQSWPSAKNLRALMLGVVTPGEFDAAHPPTISQLNSSLGEDFDGYHRYLARSTRSAEPIAFLAALILGFVAQRTRRLHFASALHSGVRRVDVVSIALLEAAAWSAAGAAASGAVLVAIARGAALVDRWPVFLSEVGTPLAAMVGGVAGSVLAALLTREKQLFRYFKDR